MIAFSNWILKKDMAGLTIPDQKECKQLLESYKDHDEGTSQEGAAPLFDQYTEEQRNLHFMNKHMQTEGKKYEWQDHEETKFNENGSKDMANPAAPKMMPFQPLPLIRRLIILAIKCVKCGMYVLSVYWNVLKGAPSLPIECNQ
jgi:hypothetical protein